MITECYIVGRYDFGIGKCGVVIVEQGVLLHQVAWVVPARWQYEGEDVEADAPNCEILAACYALNWCVKNGRQLTNIYATTPTAQTWYYRQAFPQSRNAMAKAYYKAYDEYNAILDAKGVVNGRVYAEYVPREDMGRWETLVNEIAINAK